ncbi:TPR and ankyrin repeat-containing protein 1-like [Ruditapes philippinarum]|uniref:TPR and ankyrin repeat-containing protein 1-like n=1 Tax=Ruditapes philippinarum TaxID=129788 RepID=UPI00295BC05A|nr:TPR and ankyrin repeat-containing protein 1-like [Ruditapes philippinarum]
MAGFQRFPNPDPMFMFKELKDNGNKALKKNRLAEAHHWYNAALCFLQQPSISPQIANEHHVILCNRSHVFYRQGLYQQSEDDALTAISICPKYVKAYWRASQAILADPRNKKELAVKYLADALWLVFQEDGNEQDQRHFLTEICKLASDANITGSKQTTLRNLHLPDARNKIWLSVVKKLCDQNKWESMAMLLIHYDSRNVQHSLNTLDVSEWKCGDIIVGKLLSSLSDDKMAVYGERLAIFLLQKGASIETIEEYTMTNSLHFLINLSLRIRSVLLLRFVLDNFECIRAKINYQDNEGNTALHLVVKASVDNVVY